MRTPKIAGYGRGIVASLGENPIIQIKIILFLCKYHFLLDFILRVFEFPYFVLCVLCYFHQVNIVFYWNGNSFLLFIVFKFYRYSFFSILKLPQRLIRSRDLAYPANLQFLRYYSTSLINIADLHPQPARYYSTLATERRSDHETSKLDPNWVTGFVDGEGCFACSIIKNKNSKLGWMIQPCLKLTQHVRDKTVLYEIQNYLGVGHVTRQGPNAVQLRVQSVNELETVINHFKNYTLQTQKESDFKLFLMIHSKMKRKEHLTIDGLQAIVAMRASMNWGLSEKLVEGFPDVVPVERPLVELPISIHPYWLAGFTSGEGSFMIKIRANKTYSVGFQVILVFVITQHLRDQQLLISIKEYLGCGNLYKNREIFEFKVSKLSDILNKILPFFKRYPIIGVKALDFADWCKVAELMKEKKHLTKEGLEEIYKIKVGMNKGRQTD